MAWERRKNGLYYYRVSRAQNGRVVKKYCGAGSAGEAAALEDATRRKEREARRRADADDREKVDLVVGLVHDLHDQVDEAMRAALSHAGFHEHRGEWRRRRHGQG